MRVKTTDGVDYFESNNLNNTQNLLSQTHALPSYTTQKTPQKEIFNTCPSCYTTQRRKKKSLSPYL